MIKHWVDKFRNAAHGVWLGTLGQSSFAIHIPLAILVIVCAIVLRCSAWQFAVLAVCIGWVMSLELMNSAIEYLARGLCHEHNNDVGKALDIASGAVLIASLTAALIGAAILGYQAIELFGQP